MTEATTQNLYGGVLIKGKQIMDFILEAQTAPTLKQISDQVDMTKSTVLKILKTLEYCGFVRRNGEAKQYYLGTVFLGYAQKVDETFDIRQIALPLLSELRDQTGETINLGIIEDNTITLLEKLESPQSVYLVSRIGGGMNMYSSAMGKVTLAQYDSKKLNQYFSKITLTKLTPHTVTSEAKLRRNLVEIRQQGYSVDDEENQPDVYCIGFSIATENKVYGAFSISIPKYRVDQTKLAAIVKRAKVIQKRIIAGI
ncbi:transcriptional regulator [Paucilactobacillus hokkaidonensis JCM 18461]|uniref:Transcriptional regulator n=2 Tax=Paucilactobacillus hokkaidonensis TaxID=1193095 RepID=A0A0A1GW90_9LACO|nr:IclR family transcriptional regulator [Paucilactobacillus hokkaidonensis]KRO09276.1 transcriptional regulator [Paucilactobacillus hokkaidonensis]BAP85314.1 transcriptional regulator [Paucilactobacillus hokkaidonensis JCM 18461]